MKKWLIIAVVLVAAGLTFGQFRKTVESEVRILAEVKQEVSSFTKLDEATNSEGDKKFVKVSRRSAQGGRYYAFSVVDAKKETEKTIYETTADPDSSMSIPWNSWSPDYKQVFIRVYGLAGENYYVFNSDGTDFSGGQKFIAVNDYWEEKNIGGRIKEITGWAGDNLLMVYTENKDGSHGPAYWFVVNTRKFMQVREL